MWRVDVGHRDKGLRRLGNIGQVFQNERDAGVFVDRIPATAFNSGVRRIADVAQGGIVDEKTLKRRERGAGCDTEVGRWELREGHSGIKLYECVAL